MTHAVPLLDKNDRCSLIFADGETIVFEPLFGYAQYIPLPDSKRKVCNLSELTDAALGRNVKDVLANSRVLDRSEIDAFFEDEQVARWVKESGEIMFRLAHKKNKAAFYKNMMRVPTGIEGGVVSFRPTKHDRADYYSGISPGSGPEIVKIPLSSSDEEIGQALKLAFTRCIGVGAFEFHKKLKELGWE